MIDLLPSSRVSRAFGSEVAYSDALSNVHKFNARLLRERRLRLRLPFVDSQTHIIQSPTQNHLWKQPSQRLMPSRHDQVACYARKEWHKRRPHPRPTVTQSQASNSSNNAAGTNELPADSVPSKNLNVHGTIPVPMEDDPRVLVRAGELGMSNTDMQTISTVENPAAAGGRATGASSDDSSQSSLPPPMTGLVQPQQPHWPQHNVGTHNHHLQNYILEGDDDLDDMDFDDYGGNGPATPGGSTSPVSGSGSRSKRGNSSKRVAASGSKKSSTGGNSTGNGASSNASVHPGQRRQQYALADLPFACDYCPARYKTKPGLQYHLAKHKEANTDIRPGSSGSAMVENGGSLSPTPMAMKQKYMNPSMEMAQQPPHPMYPNPGMPVGQLPHPGGPPGMPTPPYPMNYPPHPHHPQAPHPFGMPPHIRPHQMPPSASMPLTVAALSGAAPHANAPYYPHQQHMMMPQHPYPQQFQQPSKPPAPSADMSARAPSGVLCDFCSGDEQENKNTKLPEEMISCKDCGGYAHPTCLKFTPSMVRLVKTYPWQCMECKTCTECGNSENDSELLFCDGCDRGYHMYCCSPPLSAAPEGDWRCKLCCAQFGEQRT